MWAHFLKKWEQINFITTYNLIFHELSYLVSKTAHRGTTLLVKIKRAVKKITLLEGFFTQ